MYQLAVSQGHGGYEVFEGGYNKIAHMEPAELEGVVTKQDFVYLICDGWSPWDLEYKEAHMAHDLLRRIKRRSEIVTETSLIKRLIVHRT